MQDLFIDQPAEGVVRLRINRPEARNSLSVELRRKIVAELARLDANKSVRAVILAGGEKVFAAGADISELKGTSPIGMMQRATNLMWSAIAGFSKPLIAAVRGAAFGGGFELAMSTDIIVAGSKARFALPEVTLGLIPGGGGTQRLIRLAGKHVAMDILMSGRVLSGEEALGFGIISRYVDDDALEDAAVGLAATIAGKAPLAIQLAKEAALLGSDAPLATGLALETRAIQVLFDSDDMEEGTAAFFEKRSPKFTGQ